MKEPEADEFEDWAAKFVAEDGLAFRSVEFGDGAAFIIGSLVAIDEGASTLPKPARRWVSR